jgi:hypothetical protein
VLLLIGLENLSIRAALSAHGRREHSPAIVPVRVGVDAPSVQKLSLTYYTHNHALVRLPRSALRV